MITRLSVTVLCAVYSCAWGDSFDDVRRLGRGLNLGNTQESVNEGDWAIVLEDWHFKAIAERGFQSVRLPIKWSAHASESAPYTIEVEFFSRIDWVVQQAGANDLGIVLNMYDYEGINADPVGHRDRFLSLWSQIANRYRNRPRNVYFGLLNEPNADGDHQLDAKAWNSLLADAIDVIRQANPDRAVVVGPSDWNLPRAIDTLELPNDDHLIATVHFYEPFPFTHQGADWMEGGKEWLGTPWTGTPEEKLAIDGVFDRLADWSRNHRVPMYLGEFGTYRLAEVDDRARWTEHVRRAAESRGFAWSYWEFGAGFGAYDLGVQQWIKPIADALVPSPDFNGDGTEGLTD